jgi:L-lactate dehydrogenase complex protein LldG
MRSNANPAREKILARIASGLRVAVPIPPQPTANTAVFPAIDDKLDRFRRECEVNGTECVISQNPQESAAAVGKILAALPAGPVFIQDALRDLLSSAVKGLDFQYSSDGPATESCQATITRAESLVAQTGSVLLSSTCGGRRGSIVAPVHIVVAEAGQLIADLHSALAQAVERGTAHGNSFLCLTTGSSRTGDIEKVLVKAAHGPRRLVVVLSLTDQ